MLSSLPSSFREHGLQTDVRTLLVLRRAMKKGLVNTLGDLHNVLKGIVVKKPEEEGPYIKAFYAYFLNISVAPGQSLEDAILRSETFQKWKSGYVEEADKDIDLNPEDLVNTFLDQVHLTTYDIKQVINETKLFRACKQCER